MTTFSDSVRLRSDSELVALLTDRPDLASPSPSTLQSLAARAMSRASLLRAAAGLDQAHLQVLESVWALTLLGEPATAPRVVAAVAGPTPSARETDDVVRVLGALDALALLWQADPGVFRPAPGVDEIQDAFPAGLGPSLADGPETSSAPAGRLSADGLAALLTDAPAGVDPVLAALTWGPPVGLAPSPDSPTARPVRWLVDHGLLLEHGPGQVALPRELAMALREGRTHRGLRTEPALPASPAGPGQAATVEAESARAAQEIVRLVADLVALWQTTPAPVLKSGGLGVRDLRRLAAQLETDESSAVFAVELAAMAGLVDDDGDDPASYAPTVESDDWLAADLAGRWAALAASWVCSARAPWLVGSRDDKGALRSALDPDLRRTWVPRLRAEVLDLLSRAPGAVIPPETVLDLLRWRSPRSVPPAEPVQALLAEAAALGVTGAGALSSAGGVLAQVPPLTVPDADTVSSLVTTLDAALPAAVDDLLLQGDLTGVVPGRPTTALAALLADCADVESRGAALTVRFTAGSVTRALDAGRRPQDLLAELAAHARDGVPQPLEYLVHDAARRHGQIRLGAASSYVRVDDPVLLAGLVDDPTLRALGLFALAPTVLASTAPVRQLLATLRERGLAPVAESSDGQVVVADSRTPKARVPGRRTHRSPALRDPAARAVDGVAAAGATEAAREHRLRLLVEQLRHGAERRGAAGGRTADEHLPGSQPGTTDPVGALALLREAAADGQEVWLDMTGPSGGATRRRIRPLQVDGGRLHAVDVVQAAELTVAVHRIVAVTTILPAQQPRPTTTPEQEPA